MYKVSVRPLHVAASPTEVIACSFLRALLVAVQVRKAFDHTYKHMGQLDVTGGDGDQIIMGVAAQGDQPFAPVLIVDIEELPQEPDSSKQANMA